MTVTPSLRAGLETLRLDNGHACVEVCPARGALVTSFVTRGDELLFLDEATFADTSKNVRGGVPILFPLAGAAPPGSAMKQHGFARTAQWAQLEASDARIVLGLVSSAATKALFAHDFELRYAISLEGDALHLEWVVRNTGDDAWPLQLGLHPYFRVPVGQKARARVETDATRAYDNGAKVFVEVTEPLPLGGGDEVDVHLLNHSPAGTVLHRGDGSAIRLEWSSTFHTLVTWTLPGQPFICVEPWSSPSLPARDGAPLPMLRPGDEAKFELTVLRSP